MSRTDIHYRDGKAQRPRGLWLSVIFLLVGLFSCSAPTSKGYREFYQHLNHIPKGEQLVEDSDFFLVLLVDARHLDYTECRSFIRTVAKHPSDGSKSGDVGHAWVCLRGIVDQEVIALEGGHSGETGRFQARYFDGVMNSIDFGDPNPTEVTSYTYEPDPVKYLWEVQRDGFFQCGRGAHWPTYAIKVSLTQEQFQSILCFIETYDFSTYSLTSSQCTSFAAAIASLAGLDLEFCAFMQIPSSLTLGGANIRLWSDPCYSELIVPSPDVLERSMMRAVREGRAEAALEWYAKTHRRAVWSRARSIGELFMKFPERYERTLHLR